MTYNFFSWKARLVVYSVVSLSILLWVVSETSYVLPNNSARVAKLDQNRESPVKICLTEIPVALVQICNENFLDQTRLLKDPIVGIRDWVAGHRNGMALSFESISLNETLPRIATELMGLGPGDRVELYRALLEALGISSRVVTLATQNYIDGTDPFGTHITLEVLDPQRNRWLLSDPYFGTNFFCVDGGEPQDLPSLYKCRSDGKEITPAHLFAESKHGGVEQFRLKLSDLLYAIAASARVDGVGAVDIPRQGWLGASAEMYNARN